MTQVIVPDLAAPPPKAIDALEETCVAKKDSATCKWIVDLEKHYQKLDKAHQKK